MADAPRTRSSSSSNRSLGARLTAKVGPLPVWAWALALLAVGYLVYRFTGAGSSSTSSTSSTTDTSSTDTAPAADGGQPGPDQTGTTDTQTGLNDTLLSQLSGVPGQLDALTQAVLSAEAFVPGAGDSGSGSTVPNTGAGVNPGGVNKPAASTPAKPAARAKAPAHVTYYTYKPGKAPKGKKAQEAPAHGPAGTTLHFASGRGYYYA